ncbi:barley B recombinant-like protein A [Dendrobium catenatum]|uniref:GAGA-binding transcriptional activator n=1 Tax=Dendrobium catenatum TaxID=906689 RepID=A0A2I0WCW4_9ASPA|nr:barley B recombinant-like protein A [Dendrobium catenatum]XP_020686970.1 barley B recombinant-like protein A [Dendrobium catenatum]PKU73493.1 Barley B recombinant-like protein B [Dendrobium catenatum]
MDDDGTLGIQNWGGYYRAPPLKGNLGLQLMPSVGERDTKPFFSGLGSGGGYIQRECEVTGPSAMPMGFARNIWYNSNRDSSKMLNVFHGNHQEQSHSYGSLLPEATAGTVSGTAVHTLQMLQNVEVPLKEERVPAIEEPAAPQQEVVSLNKRSKGQGRPSKASKPKKDKKATTPREESSNPFGRGRSAKKTMDMVINGIDLDLSGMPAPVCTCTGRPQQCYRWGAGGWQSACCTTIISIYPLPMSTKRRGARIAGRKMSQGAFKKVLEKLAGEGQDFSSPIDLKPFWAKHGTNKFVTIR